MNILFFGDIVGKPGRLALARVLPGLRKEYEAALVVANVENAAHGFGITPGIIDELEEAGVDLFTSGNHIWKNSKGVDFLEGEPEQVVVPANYNPGHPGRRVIEKEVDGTRVVAFSLVGQAFTTDADVESPFAAFDRLYKEHGQGNIVLVDLHAEATGEKRAFGWYVDGRATAVIGTHTHVPTADEQVLPKGTGYITDAGFCGASESSLGMDKNLAIQKVAQQIEVHLEPPQGANEATVNGAAITVDPEARSAVSIKRIDRRVSL